MEVRFWGVRGSTPVSGHKYQNVGGHSSCVSIHCDSEIIILDAGTGLYDLGGWMIENAIHEASLCFSHYHLDHITGFPFFAPAYNKNFTLHIYGGKMEGMSTIKNVLEGDIFKKPLFPVPFSVMQAKMIFNHLKHQERIQISKTLEFTCGDLNHPGGALGYRIKAHDKVVCYIADTEHYDVGLDNNVLDLIKDADLVIYDATFTQEEYPLKRGWGHSTPEQGIKVCQRAGAKKLALYHHDPSHDDDFLMDLEKKVQNIWPFVFIAKQGMHLEI